MHLYINNIPFEMNEDGTLTLNITAQPTEEVVTRPEPAPEPEVSIPSVAEIFGVGTDNPVRRKGELEEFEGSQVFSFDVFPDTQSIGFRYNGSVMQMVQHLRDISLSILNAAGEPITPKIGSYAGVLGPKYDGIYGTPDNPQDAGGQGDGRNTPFVTPGRYYLVVECRLPRPVPLILEVS